MRNHIIAILAVAMVFAFMVAAGPVSANETINVEGKDNIKVVVFKIGDNNYYLENNESNINKHKMDVAPYIKSGRTFVPVRFLANALGIPDGERIGWEQATRTVTLVDKKTVKMVIGSKTMQSDGNTITMDVVPELNMGRTMLLARYVAEGLGYIVDWDQNRQLVICYPEDKPKPDLTKIIEVIEDKPAPGTVEARFKALEKTGITQDSQLDLELLDYLVRFQGDDKGYGYKWSRVPDDLWAIHKVFLTDKAEAKEQLRTPYDVTSIAISQDFARIGYDYERYHRHDVCYDVIVNGNKWATCRVQLGSEGKPVPDWLGISRDNIFEEGSDIPEWQK